MANTEEISAADEIKKQYIVVTLGGEHYGIDISFVDNIVRMSSITRVPKAPVHYKGVINLRGEVVPVMSIRVKMGLSDDVITNSSRIIILKLDDLGYVGIIVDSVDEVVTLGESDIDRNVSNMKETKGNFINGIGKDGDRLISIFDIDKVTGEGKDK
jgi:purine-binding chemotaxis protein CheW